LEFEIKTKQLNALTIIDNGIIMHIKEVKNIFRAKTLL
jgi:hypothetical protein